MAFYTTVGWFNKSWYQKIKFSLDQHNQSCFARNRCWAPNQIKVLYGTFYLPIEDSGLIPTEVL